MSRSYGFNDLETWCINNNKKFILDRWDYKKNHPLIPKEIVYSSHKKVFWFKNNIFYENEVRQEIKKKES